MIIVLIGYYDIIVDYHSYHMFSVIIIGFVPIYIFFFRLVMIIMHDQPASIKGQQRNPQCDQKWRFDIKMNI